MSEETVTRTETILGLDPRALLGRAKGRAAEGSGQVGDYELVRRVAQGGMGTVYEARQVSPGRTVALKMISSGLLASEAEVARFQREAEAGTGLAVTGPAERSIFQATAQQEQLMPAVESRHRGW